MKKRIIMGIIIIIALWIIYTIIGRQIPIHHTDYKVGFVSIYYKESSKIVLCDLAYFEVIVFEDDNYQYVYELISTGNGSCKSELFVWHQFKSYKLSDAIEQNIVSIDDFIESNLVIKRPIIIDA